MLNVKGWKFKGGKWLSFISEVNLFAVLKFLSINVREISDSS